MATHDVCSVRGEHRNHSHHPQNPSTQVEITGTAIAGNDAMETDLAKMRINRLPGDLTLSPEKSLAPHRRNATEVKKSAVMHISGSATWITFLSRFNENLLFKESSASSTILRITQVGTLGGSSHL